MSSNERPRPQYGEYATPEDQRAHIRDPQPETAPGPGSDPDAGAGAPTRPHDAPAPGSGPLQAEVGGRRVPRGWDRTLTWALLAVGLVNLAISIPAFLNMAPSLETAFQELGIGHFEATAITGPAGVALVIVQCVVWVVTASLAQLSLRRARVSFWIPVVGAVVAYVALVAILLVVVLNDPSFMAFVSAANSHN